MSAYVLIHDRLQPMDYGLPGSSVQGFSRQEFPAGDLPDPGIEPVSPALQADSLLLEPPGKSLWQSSLDYIIKNFYAEITLYACISH